MISPRYIQHIIQPERLLLSWQPNKESGKPRMRRFVAELIADGDNVRLEYLIGTDDFTKAVEAGFEDYRGFPIDRAIHNNALGAFMRRLPPRSRQDFGRFLTAIRIDPADKDKVSDFALLGYSGAILPGDGFVIINPFANANPPFELLLEIQGYRHYCDKVPYETLNTDMEVTFQAEPENEQDPDAIMALIDGRHVGYVCRGLGKSFSLWMNSGYIINAVIERINGTNESPKIYAYVTIR